MELGSAGCGYEHRNTPDMCCNSLKCSATGFSCSKYKEPLKTHRVSGDPFRLKQCGDDANQHWDELHAKERRAETLRIRNLLKETLCSHS